MITILVSKNTKTEERKDQRIRGTEEQRIRRQEDKKKRSQDQSVIRLKQNRGKTIGLEGWKTRRGDHKIIQKEH